MASSRRSAGKPAANDPVSLVSATSGAGTPPAAARLVDFAIEMHQRLLELRSVLSSSPDDFTEAGMQRMVALRLLFSIMERSTATMESLGMNGSESEYVGEGD